MQVLLVSGGVTLPPNQRVCHFSAGTDTNPIFLYNKQFYHNPSPEAPPDLLTFDAGPGESRRKYIKYIHSAYGSVDQTNDPTKCKVHS